LDLVKQLATQGTAVVATSDTRLPELAETASEYGAVGYLSKSDNPDDIEALLTFIAGVSVEGSPHQ
jgi:DNA-binding NarL/FixJ family response regulator